MTLADWYAAQPNRCPWCHYDPPTQGHSSKCADRTPVAPTGPIEDKATAYAHFKAVLRSVADSDREIHQEKVRPRIQVIPHKWRGQFYVKAKNEGLISFERKEPSLDRAGKNTDKDQKVWKLRAAA